MSSSPVANTIRYLRLCQQARAEGFPVSFTNDPRWLLHAAINRRGGWMEDRWTRAFSRPNHRGAFPRRASLDARGHLHIIARAVNSRAIVRVSELGEWKRYLLAAIPERFESEEE